MQGGRMSRGWQLAKKSWAVLRADRSLMLFPIISFFAGVGALVLVITPGILASAAADGSGVPLYIAGILAAYVLTAVAIFFQVALPARAAQSLDGKDTSVGDGFRLAFGKISAIVGWSLLQATVGLVLNAI